MEDRTYPMTNTHPNGSFLMVGFMNLKARSISSAFSSLAHLCRLRDTKTMSFSNHPLSAIWDSKAGLPRSALRAWAIRFSLSLILKSVNQVGRGSMDRGDLRPVELAELDQAELDGASLMLDEGLFELGDAVLEFLDRGEFDLGNVGGHHDEGSGQY